MKVAQVHQLLATWSGPAKLKAAIMEAVRGAPRLADHINSRHLDKLADLASRDVRLAVLAVEDFGHLNWWGTGSGGAWTGLPACMPGWLPGWLVVAARRANDAAVPETASWQTLTRHAGGHVSTPAATTAQGHHPQWCGVHHAHHRGLQQV
jgi:hypothetical protein